MKKDLFFPGDELALLAAMDRSGCVMTEDGGFFCDLENGRLPVRVRGTLAAAEGGFQLSCRVAMTPRTLAIAGVFLALFVLGVVTYLYTGTATSALLFGILCAAMAINYRAQSTGALDRFETKLLRGTWNDLA